MTTIRSPCCRPASRWLPRAVPSGQVCALSSTLPASVPGAIASSQANIVLPAVVSGGVPGTLPESRGGEMTVAPLVMPGTVIRRGVKGETFLSHCWRGACVAATVVVAGALVVAGVLDGALVVADVGSTFAVTDGPLEEPPPVLWSSGPSRLIVPRATATASSAASTAARAGRGTDRP